jgi:SAM-dependent methyltransferase
MIKSMSYADYTNQIIDGYPSGMRVYRQVISHIGSQTSKVLHLGCGHDLSDLLSTFPPSTQVIGLDPDFEAVSAYPGEGHVGDGADMPFPNDFFDLIISEMVLEHLENPLAVFTEANRVLRPGGHFISVTPNFLSYKSLAANFTPHSIHKLAVRKLRRESKRQDNDVYPTYYRANTSFRLKKLAISSNLHPERIEYVDNGPTWFQRIPILFEIGRIYHTLLRIPALDFLRCNIIVTLKKPLDSI